MSKHTICAWKQKFGGLEVAEAQEWRYLREENGKLKKLVAERALDKEASKAVTSKAVIAVSATAQLRVARADVEHIRTTFPGMGERHACGPALIAVVEPSISHAQNGQRCWPARTADPFCAATSASWQSGFVGAAAPRR